MSDEPGIAFVEALATALHHSLCPTSHHDNPVQSAPCFRQYEFMAASVAPQLALPVTEDHAVYTRIASAEPDSDNAVSVYHNGNGTVGVKIVGSETEYGPVNVRLADLRAALATPAETEGTRG